MPGMIEPGRLSQADLANDLRPQMQRGIGVLPGGVGQFRPGPAVIGHALRQISPSALLFRYSEESLLKWRDYSSICKTLSRVQAPMPNPQWRLANDPPPRYLPGQDTLSQREDRASDDLLSRGGRSAASYAPDAARVPNLLAYVP